MLRLTRIALRPLHFGFLIGILFGFWNLLYSWLFPLADDTPTALLAFYGPMFSVWAAVASIATRRTGRLLTGVTTGAGVSFATFCIYDLTTSLSWETTVTGSLPLHVCASATCPHRPALTPYPLRT